MTTPEEEGGIGWGQGRAASGELEEPEMCHYPPTKVRTRYILPEAENGLSR